MKLLKALLPLGCFVLFGLLTTGAAPSNSKAASSRSRIPAAGAADGNKLVYADFETVKDGRPVSNRGGLVQLYAYQSPGGAQSHFHGAKGTGVGTDPDAAKNPTETESNAPEIVRPSKSSPNKAIAFNYELPTLDQYAGVGVQIHGRADEDGKHVPDDVSGYKELTLQIYVTGIELVTVEFVSEGQGISIIAGNPGITFRVQDGFNTYKVVLKQAVQPNWVDAKIDTKELMRKLTSINVLVSCNQCLGQHGTVVVDNLVFEK
ncbi:MAG TPA: hypothetical protein VJX67_13065 [Blastocatellia bacterium]|nr:hypothetical protein [Blastocatellia bacterium]